MNDEREEQLCRELKQPPPVTRKRVVRLVTACGCTKDLGERPDLNGETIEVAINFNEAARLAGPGPNQPEYDLGCGARVFTFHGIIGDVDRPWIDVHLYGEKRDRVEMSGISQAYLKILLDLEKDAARLTNFLDKHFASDLIGNPVIDVCIGLLVELKQRRESGGSPLQCTGCGKGFNGHPAMSLCSDCLKVRELHGAELKQRRERDAESLTNIHPPAGKLWEQKDVDRMNRLEESPCDCGSPLCTYPGSLHCRKAK